jgi:hypothetical protein
MSSCDGFTPRLFCSVVLSSPPLPRSRAGVWRLYFQIATARSHVVKTTFSRLSGSFTDSHKVASSLLAVSSAPSKGRGTSSLTVSSILLFYKYKKQAARKATTLWQQFTTRPTSNTCRTSPSETSSVFALEAQSHPRGQVPFRAYRPPPLTNPTNLSPPWLTVVSPTTSPTQLKGDLTAQVTAPLTCAVFYSESSPRNAHSRDHERLPDSATPHIVARFPRTSQPSRFGVPLSRWLRRDEAMLR